MNEKNEKNDQLLKNVSRGLCFPPKHPTISSESYSCLQACECVIADRSLNSPRSAVGVKCLAQRHLEAIVEAVNC